MIRIRCECGNTIDVPEAEVNRDHACQQCPRRLRPVCAEALPDGAGSGDFDAMLLVRAGPKSVAEQIVLGGCAEIGMGKLPASAVALPGNKVSRQHAKLARVDFGPSRWRIVDTHSTNGLFVNDTRVAEHDLQPGDKVNIGEYTLEYATVTSEEALAADEPADTPVTSSPTSREMARSAAAAGTDSPWKMRLRGVAMTAGGLAGLALTAGWPMYEVLNEAEKVTVSFKGILASAMVLVLGLTMLVLGDKGLPWKKDPARPKHPLAAKEKALVGLVVTIPLLLLAYVWYFFNSHGYSFFR